MMSVKINLGAWGSVFAVPSRVVDEGLKFSDGVKLKVLLCLLRNADRELDYDSVSAATGVNVTDIPEAIEYWINAGVFQRNGDELLPDSTETTAAPVDNSNKEEYPANNSAEEIKQPAAQTVEQIAEDVNSAKQRFTVSRPQKPDYAFTAQRLVDDEELKILVSEAQTALGKVLSNSDAATLLMLKDTCGLPLDVILMLIQYSISIDKGNMRTIEKIGVSWSDDGVNSVEAAENKIRMARQSSKQYAIVSEAFGLRNAGSPTKKQLEYCAKWTADWKFSPEMLREAYERCVDSKGTMKFNYIDAILKRWQSSNIHTLKELAEFEAKTPKTAPKGEKKNPSYNIDELSQFSVFKVNRDEKG